MTARLVEELQRRGHYAEQGEPAELLEQQAPAPRRVPVHLTAAAQRQFREAIQELAAREVEALRLYEPTPEQERFHASFAPERIIRGGNRGGKTLAACVEFARMVTNQDPYGKYPKSGRAIVVGKDLLHCSKVLYRKLFKPGAFKIIRDPETRKWRAFRPWQEWDARNKRHAKPAPPLIPPRFYSPKDVSWENKREEIVKTVRLRTGWDSTFFSSLSAPPQGWDADGALFDEEIEHPAWYPETSARLLDHVTWDDQGRAIGGKFVWSATPQAGTQRLYELSERAEACKDDPQPPIQEFFVNILDNPFIPEQSKKDFIAKLSGDEEEYRVRILGDFSIKGMRVYPEWDPRRTQGIPWFEIPSDWARYLFIDPGRQVAAALFVAVPPRDHRLHGSYVVYDELYLKKASAESVAASIAEKVAGHRFQAFILDGRAGRQTEIGSGRTIEQQYTDAFKRHGVESEATRNGFIWGNDDVKAGVEQLRGDISPRNGVCRLLLFAEKCPNFVREMKDYSYKRVGKDRVVTDEPLQRDNHAIDCARYCACFDPKYVKPRLIAKRESWTAKYLAAKKRKAQKDSGWNGAVRLG